MRNYFSPSFFFLLIFSISSLAPIAHGEGTSVLIKPGAVLEKVAGGFTFTEGPAADADGNV